MGSNPTASVAHECQLDYIYFGCRIWSTTCRAHNIPMCQPKKKRCAKCGRVRLIKFFYKNRKHADGIHSYCKTCSNFVVYAWKAKNLEKVLAWHREHGRKKYHENIELSRSLGKSVYWKDVEKSRARSRRYYHERKRKNEALQTMVLTFPAVVFFILRWVWNACGQRSSQ